MIRRFALSRWIRRESERLWTSDRQSLSRSLRRTLQDDVAQNELERVGYSVLPVLDRDQLAAVQEVFDELGAAPDDPGIAINWSFHSRSQDYKRGVSERLWPLVADAIDNMLDEYEPFLTTFIIKWPGPNSGFAPHQDPSLVDERRFRGVTVWIPLGDTGQIDGRDNGMLHFVPGSHLFSDRLRVSDVDRWTFAEHDGSIVGEHGVGVPTTAGEAIVFDNRVIHYSMPNQTNMPRVVLSLGMRPRESSCVLLRCTPQDEIEMFEIPDDFYLDVLPAEQHSWNPPGEPFARFELRNENWTDERFAQACREAPVPRRGIRPSAGEPEWMDPDAFCALCGSTEGLDEGERADRNNAQLVCSRCREDLDRIALP